MEEKYRLTYECEQNVTLYDAQEGVLFDLDDAIESYDLMLCELKRKAQHFSVRLTQCKDGFCGLVYDVKTIKHYKQ